jgi:phage repressor protein C with HTH and peptisase S24 domain
MTVGAQIRKLRKERNMTIQDLADAIDWDVGNLSRLERGKQGYTPDKLSRIANAFGVPIKTLFAEPTKTSEEISFDGNSDYPAIPFVQFKLSAGVTGFAVEYIDQRATPIVFAKDWFTKNGYKPSSLFAVMAKGNSMDPGIRDGDLVVLNTDDTRPVDGQVFALNYEGELVIKRMFRIGGSWLIVSDNSDKRLFPDRPAHEGVHVLGKVIHKQSEHI